MKAQTQNSKGESEELNLDSTYLTAFDMAHQALKAGLVRAGRLNIVQYHVLIKIFAAGAQGITQSDLGVALDLKPNVVTQAVKVLEKTDFITRVKGGRGDGRVRVVHITEAGINHVDAANSCIVEQLYKIFPTENDLFRSILEASIAAGAYIDPPLSKKAVNRFPASRALVSLELIRRTIESLLQRLASLSFNEYRVLQCLNEAAVPLRSVDVVKQLRMSPSAVARSADHLVAQALATRLSSPIDRKAVFLAATESGVKKQKSIADVIDSLARNYLWKNLNQEQRHVIAQVGHVVIVRLQEKEEAERKVALSLLQPID